MQKIQIIYGGKTPHNLKTKNTMKKLVKKVALNSAKQAIKTRANKVKTSTVKGVKTSLRAIKKVAVHPTTQKVAIQLSIVVVAKLVSNYIDSKNVQYLITEKYADNVS